METRDLSERMATEVVDGVYLAQLAAGDRMSIQHFHIEPGAEVPAHEHEHEQLGYLYEGTLTFDVDGEEIIVSAGESYAIQSNEPHGVVNHGEDPANGIDIFSPPRLDVPWNE